jgi:hypothetical protein
VPTHTGEAVHIVRGFLLHCKSPLLALTGSPVMSAFPVDVSRQSLPGDAITGRAA